MSSMATKPLLLQSLDPDIRAFVYQQMNDFVPFFLPDSQVAVLVEEEEQSKKDKDSPARQFFVTITLTGGGAYVESKAAGIDVIEATKAAKDKLLEQLTTLQNELMSSQEREEELRLVKDKILLH